MRVSQKIKLGHLIVIELLLLIGALVLGVLQRRSMTEVPVDLALFQSNQGFQYDDGRWVITEGQLDNKGFLTGADPEDSKAIHITSEAMELPKGDYTLSIQYGSSVDQSVSLLCGENYKHLLHAEPFILSKNQIVTDYHFTASENIPDFQVQIEYNNYGTATINGVSITPNANAIKRCLLGLSVLFLLVDYLFIRREWIRSHRTRLMILSMVVLMLSVPMCAYGITGGHDLMFHLMRIEGIAQGLHNHQFPVRMSPVWLDGYGYPVSIYYGDILLYIPAVFRLFGYSVMTSYKIFILLVNVATVWMSYLCFRGIFKDYKIAVVTATAYSIAPYRFSCMYARHAVGEYSALIFFPLIALAVYRIYTGESKGRRRDNIDAVLLALGMVGLLGTHMLSAEMTVILLAITFLAFIKVSFSWRVIRTFLQVVCLTLLMGAFFIVPFLDYYMNVDVKINANVEDGLSLVQWGGAYLTDYFNVFAEPFGWNSSFLNERMALTPGLMLIVALMLSIGYILKGKASKSMKVFTAFSLLTLWLASNVFPWDFLTLHVWSGFSVIQFPWRFIGPADLFLSLTLGSVLVCLKQLPRGKELLDMEPEELEWATTQSRVENRRNRTAVTWFLVCGALSMIVYIQHYSNYDYVVNYCDTAELDNAAVTSFFLREDTLEQAVPKHLMKNTNVESFEKVRDEGTEKAFQVVVGEGGGTLELPVFNYKGWHVVDANGNRYKISDGTQDLISVSFDEAYTGEILAYFQAPWYWRIAEVISLITLVGSLWAVHWKKKYEL